MTGRGNGRLIHTSDNPSVTIGVTLSTSPSSLPLASSEPFYIVVTARIQSTPYPDKPITLRTDPTPLDDLSNRSFSNITCIKDFSKKIVIWPTSWLFPRDIDTENLRSHFPFVTIPRKDQGAYSVRHEVPRDKVEAADLRKGERYTVSLTHKCLGTRWWTFASLEELEGVRFVAWRPQTGDDAGERLDPELAMDEERERKRKYGDTPTTMGEQPSMLVMVPEVGEVEFEVD